MKLAKSIALKCISSGIRLPQEALDRVGELQTLRQLLRLLQIDCVVDAGANRGQFATELRGIGYGGSIISFEPLPSEFTVLAQAFSGDRNWQGRQCALGSRADRLQMTVPGLTVLGSLLQPRFGSPNTTTHLVDVRRLDQVLPELLPDWASRRIFLKMDTQGYDLEVFRGATDILDAVIGLQSELSVRPLYENMPSYLEALGCYERAAFSLYNLSVVGRSENGGVIELNCFMHRRAEGRT